MTQRNLYTKVSLGGNQVRFEFKDGYMPPRSRLELLKRIAAGEREFPVAHLEGADLAGVNLHGVNLSDAKLSGANLTGADLSNSLLGGAQFERANLEHASLAYAVAISFFAPTASFRHASLVRASLLGSEHSCSDFSDADLREADLSDARFPSSRFVRANLRGAKLRSTYLDGAAIAAADLRSADLTGASLVETFFVEDSIDGPDLTDATIAHALFTPERVGYAYGGLGGSFLDLATANGLESTIHDDSTFVAKYLRRAFDYLHEAQCRENDYDPRIVRAALRQFPIFTDLYEQTPPPTSLISNLTIVNDELIHYLRAHPQELYEIPHRRFEELVAQLLANFGWEVNLTAQTRDGGYDIFAISRDLSGLRTSWIVECKRNKPENAVGIGVVRSLYGVKTHSHIGMALLATTSRFSRDASAFVSSHYDMELRDYAGIVDWLNAYKGPKNTR